MLLFLYPSVLYIKALFISMLLLCFGKSNALNLYAVLVFWQIKCFESITLPSVHLHKLASICLSIPYSTASVENETNQDWTMISFGRAQSTKLNENRIRTT